jgi:hypothetical protein
VWDVGPGQMRSVHHTDPLTASIYLYDVQAVVSLSKVSQRTGRSKPSATGHASTMANCVKERDGYQCWVTRMPIMGINSHVCPKRMGDHLLRFIYDAFVSTPPPPVCPYMMKYVASPSLVCSIRFFTHMNLVCDLWPRCEACLFSVSLVDH